MTQKDVSKKLKISLSTVGRYWVKQFDVATGIADFKPSKNVIYSQKKEAIKNLDYGFEHPTTNFKDIFFQLGKNFVPKNAIHEGLGYPEEIIKHWFFFYEDYKKSYEKGRNEALNDHLENIAKHGRKDWKALAWLVEKNCPDYSKNFKHEKEVNIFIEEGTTVDVLSLIEKRLAYELQYGELTAQVSVLAKVWADATLTPFMKSVASGELVPKDVE